jgi:hypothetical protein
MTAINGDLPQEFSAIGARLNSVGDQFRTVQIIRAIAKSVAVLVPAGAGVVAIAGLASPSQWLMVGMLILWVALAAVCYVRWLHATIWHRPTFAEVARWVEERGGELGLHNELINAVLLAQESEPQHAKQHAKQVWIPHVLRELDAATSAVNLGAAVPWKTGRNMGLIALAVLCLVGFAVALFPATFSRGMHAIMSPGKFVPIQGAVRITDVSPKNDTILAGQSVSFTVDVESPNDRPIETRVDAKFASGKAMQFPMTAVGTGNGKYSYTLNTVAEDLDYTIIAGDSQSERYHISVLPDIHVTSFKLVVTPPAYTGKEPQTITLTGKEMTAAKGSLEVPLGSDVEVTASLDMDVREMVMDIVDHSPVVMDHNAEKTFSKHLTIRDPSVPVRYSILANDTRGRTLRHFPDDSAGGPSGSGAASYLTISPIADQPPTIAVSDPGRDMDAKPGDVVRLAAQTADDYGLVELRLETAKGTDGQFNAVKTWPIQMGKDGKPAKAFSIKHELPLPATDYKLGDVLRYRFVATDNRNLTSLSPDLGAQTSASQVFTINFNDVAANEIKSSKAWDELRKQLQALLDRQTKLHDDARGVLPVLAIDAAKAKAGPIGDGQRSLRADMATLAKDFPFEPAMKLIQRTLQVLVNEDATSAVDRAADIMLLSDSKALGPIATKLRQHQSRIIDVLESLLAISSSEQRKLSQVAQKEGDDRPNTAEAEAWKKMLEDLKKFDKEQRAVIDATTDLAKKPKDQYDQNDDKKLADLAAVEDKWEKFMNNAMADASKIAEQDQANGSVADDLIQMKVELTMAKNALDAKAAQIATPAEANGLESAKSLSTHIERWLGHTPDRSKWEMEEATAQNEAPMAELPKQLQDMMGDLMDQEEDETQQMESLGSKFADSLDKGAGWDAADGPISNMSAQGVTGNQLPKDMEIQGRSGEGREGRSDGEFVGSTAEGKGGRRTPTRMTPEPFSSGKVDDKSKEPAGGATGGGKKGAFGGEGLEGAAPEEAHDPMQRLQGKQAAIHNEAERLKLQMHANGYNNFKLLEASVMMRKAEENMKAYRYNTALFYQKEAVQSLNTAKVLAEGQMHVTMDTTPTTSTKTQKDIQDALNGTMPKGYADPVKAYFTKLSTDTGQ